MADIAAMAPTISLISQTIFVFLFIFHKIDVNKVFVLIVGQKCGDFDSREVPLT